MILDLRSAEKFTPTYDLHSKENNIDVMEAVRLTKLFPNAKNFIFLADIFPELFKDSKKMIAITEKGFLEEKDMMGITETDIIPIEYHSSYTYGLSLSLKEIIESQPDLFNAFFKKYDKIILDSSETTNDSAFVISDYTSIEKMFFPNYIYNFFDSVFKQFNITKQEILSILRASQFPAQFIDDESLYSKILNISDKDELFHFMVQLHDWDSLYDFFTEKRNFEEIKNSYEKEYCFRLLNQKIDLFAYIHPFIKKHIDIVHEATSTKYIDNMDDLFTLLQSYTYDSSSSEVNKYSKNYVINLTRYILSVLDPENKLTNAFNKALDNDDIILWSDDEKDKVKDYFEKHFGSFNEESNGCCIRNKENKKICIHQRNAIRDTLTLVHEFIHYYIESCSQYTSELASVYFETRVGDILIESGFPEDEVSSNFRNRIFGDRANNSLIKELISLLYKKSMYGEITEENIRDESEIDNHRQTVINANKFLRQVMMKLNSSEEFIESQLVNPEVTNAEYAKKAVEALSIQNKETGKLVSYSLGSFFANNRCDELDQIFLHFIEHSRDIDDDTLMRTLQECLKTKETVSTNSVQYFKKIESKRFIPNVTVTPEN